jgi:hypothetical protein
MFTFVQDFTDGATQFIEGVAGKVGLLGRQKAKQNSRRRGRR